MVATKRLGDKRCVGQMTNAKTPLFGVLTEIRSIRTRPTFLRRSLLSHHLVVRRSAALRRRLAHQTPQTDPWMHRRAPEAASLEERLP
jgi:hypothetical protein